MITENISVLFVLKPYTNKTFVNFVLIGDIIGFGKLLSVCTTDNGAKCFKSNFSSEFNFGTCSIFCQKKEHYKLNYH